MIITITMKMSISSINIIMWLLLIPGLKRNGYHCLWYCCNYFNDKQNKNVLPYQQCFLSQLINIITYMLSMVKRGNCKWWQRWDTLFFFLSDISLFKSMTDNQYHIYQSWHLYYNDNSGYEYDTYDNKGYNDHGNWQQY